MKKPLIIMLILCMLLLLPISASAEIEKPLGFPVIERTEEQKADIIATRKLQLLDSDAYKAGIITFDISENGKIALAVINGRIYVYDSNGTFLYGYHVYIDGDYGVGFVDENVAIYALRGDSVEIYDPNGNCLEMYRILSSYKYYDLSTQILNRTSKVANGKTYTLERDVDLISTYSRLVIYEEDGSKNIIYDISTQHIIGTVAMWIGILGFCAFCIWGITNQIRDQESLEGIWYCSELKMQISFTKPSNSFIWENGERIRCYCDGYSSKRYSRGIQLICQEFDHPVHRHGKTLFTAGIVSLDETTMIVDARQKYTFVRTDKIG